MNILKGAYRNKLLFLLQRFRFFSQHKLDFCCKSNFYVITLHRS